MGSILHFTFEISGNNPLIGIFSAINESVWEHLKIAFWPALIYLIIEYKILEKTNNFFFAKTLGIYSIILIIPVIFYSYTTFFEENLIIDIGSFVFAIIISQIISYRFLIRKKLSKNFEIFSLIALIILLLAFVIFTFYPPYLELFKDPNTGGYGIFL